MLVTTHFRDVHHAEYVRRYAEARVRAVLEHLAQHVVAVTLHVERVNARQVSCRIEAQLVAGVHVAAERSDRGALVAVDHAVDSVALSSSRSVERMRAWRPRKSHATTPGVPGAA
jgi:hypothetical protein